MNNQYKKPLLFLIVGMILIIIGATLKLQEWSGFNLVLILGLLAEAIGLILLVTKAMQKLKSK